MELAFVISGLGLILFAVLMILVYRPAHPWKYPYVGAWCSVVLVGVAILLGTYGLISSLLGWGLIGGAILIFSITVYDTIFRKHYPSTGNSPRSSPQKNE